MSELKDCLEGMETSEIPEKLPLTEFKEGKVGDDKK